MLFKCFISRSLLFSSNFHAPFLFDLFLVFIFDPASMIFISNLFVSGMVLLDVCSLVFGFYYVSTLISDF